MALREEMVEAVRAVLTTAPKETAKVTLFDSFEYTCTGNNLAHSRVLGWLAKAAWSLSTTAAVEIDVRFNDGGGVKFQPDLAIRDVHDKVRLVVDFESVNSSDARIPTKDVDAYLAWAANRPEPVEYLILTSLPRAGSKGWEVRYTSPGYWNEGHDPSTIRVSPLDYWYEFYRLEVAEKLKGRPVTFANFDGLALSIIDIAAK